LKINYFEKKVSHVSSFTSDFSGYLGIGPWTANVKDKEQNFLYQLKKAGVIDNMTVAVRTNMQDKDDTYSTIKFGSYDKTNVYSERELNMLKTADINTWDLNMASIVVGRGKDPQT
jgi:hypothetical protein